MELLQAFYSPLHTRHCPPTDDEVSKWAASHTGSRQAQRATLTLLTRLCGAWQPVAVCLGTELGVEYLNWTIHMWWRGVGGGGLHWLDCWPLASLSPRLVFIGVI